MSQGSSFSCQATLSAKEKEVSITTNPSFKRSFWQSCFNHQVGCRWRRRSGRRWLASLDAAWRLLMPTWHPPVDPKLVDYIELGWIIQVLLRCNYYLALLVCLVFLISIGDLSSSFLAGSHKRRRINPGLYSENWIFRLCASYRTPAGQLSFVQCNSGMLRIVFTRLPHKIAE